MKQQNELTLPRQNSLDDTDRSKLVVPSWLEEFAKSFDQKNQAGLFLGTKPVVRESTQRGQLQRTRSMAKLLYNDTSSTLEPTSVALEITKQAAKDFFSLSHQILASKNKSFPLAGRNKCLGMVVVPRTKLVLIAISEDKNPDKDKPLRADMVDFLNIVNTQTTSWIFELVCIPTQAEYLILRTLTMRAPHEAPKEWVDPHTRCIEVALMVALCKAGRFKKFTATETGVMAYGGTLWACREGQIAATHFGAVTRNTNYTVQDPIEVALINSESGWIDIWEPCGNHCRIYRYAMLALGAAGGPATSFMEPRGEWHLPGKIGR